MFESIQITYVNGKKNTDKLLRWLTIIVDQLI